jgi:hypothetical protein
MFTANDDAVLQIFQDHDGYNDGWVLGFGTPAVCTVPCTEVGRFFRRQDAEFAMMAWTAVGVRTQKDMREKFPNKPDDFENWAFLDEDEMECSAGCGSQEGDCGVCEECGKMFCRCRCD